MEKTEIKYKIAEKQDDGLDRVIKKRMKELGYKWYASGYDFNTKERDLAFEKL